MERQQRRSRVRLSLDRMLDDITLYWLTDTAASLCAALPTESWAKDFSRMPLDLPVAVSIFKGDFFTPPKVWGEETYSKLFYWNEVPKGGHFAAFEQPDRLVVELAQDLHSDARLRDALANRRPGRSKCQENLK